MTTLLSPFELGSLQLKNRVCMAPMTRNKSLNNVPGDNVVEYYRKRAEGDVGLIITEGTCLGHKAASGYPDVPLFDGDDALAGWQKVVDAVHGEGGKIAPQIWHVGALRRPGIEPGGDTPGYSPSGMVLPGKIVGHVMTKQDIKAEADEQHDDQGNWGRLVRGDRPIPRRAGASFAIAAIVRGGLGVIVYAHDRRYLTLAHKIFPVFSALVRRVRVYFVVHNKRRTSTPIEINRFNEPKFDQQVGKRLQVDSSFQCIRNVTAAVKPVHLKY